MARWIQSVGAACIAALSAGPLRAACIDTFPDAQVNQLLAKEAYGTCTLETMRIDYAGILKEEVKLLIRLRAAYERVLQNDTALAKPAVRKRLDEFDERVKELAGLAELIAVSAKTPDKGGKAEKGKGAVDAATASKLLQKGREVSDLLKSRIAHARDGLEPQQETDTYCKLDFHFRSSDGLAALIKKCVQ